VWLSQHVAGTGQNWHPAVQDLITLRDAHHAAGQAGANDEGPAVSGGPFAINLPRME
jgi:hypothetical protein